MPFSIAQPGEELALPAGRAARPDGFVGHSDRLSLMNAAFRLSGNCAGEFSASTSPAAAGPAKTLRDPKRAILWCRMQYDEPATGTPPHHVQSGERGSPMTQAQP